MIYVQRISNSSDAASSLPWEGHAWMKVYKWAWNIFRTVTSGGKVGRRRFCLKIGGSLTTYSFDDDGVRELEIFYSAKGALGKGATGKFWPSLKNFPTIEYCAANTTKNVILMRNRYLPTGSESFNPLTLNLQTLRRCVTRSEERELRVHHVK